MISPLMTLTTPDNTGASRVAFEYAKAVLHAGGNVTIVHGNEGELGDRESLVEKMRQVGIRTILEPRLARPVGHALVREIGEHVASGGHNCVIGNNQRDRALAVHVAQYSKLPSIICGHNQHVFRGRWPLAQLKKGYYAKAMRRADLIVCSSPQVYEEYVNDFGVDHSRCKLMPHGIDVSNVRLLDAEEKCKVRAEFFVKEDELMLVHVGRIDPQKGQDLLLKGLSLLSEDCLFKLILVGEVAEDAKAASNREYRAELVKLSEDLSEHCVQFAGWRDDYQDIVQAADLYIHPARWEGLPLTVLSAMGLAVPCAVANNTSCPPGFNNEDHGLVFDAGSPEAIRDVLLRVRNLGQNRLLQMATNARELVLSRYDMQKIGENFVSLLESVVEETESETVGS